MKYEVLNEVQQVLFVDRHSKASGLTEATTMDGKQLKRYIDTPHYSGAMAILREDPTVDPTRLAGCSVAQRLAQYEGLLHNKGYLDYSAILRGAADELETNVELIRGAPFDNSGFSQVRFEVGDLYSVGSKQ